MQVFGANVVCNGQRILGLIGVKLFTAVQEGNAGAGPGVAHFEIVSCKALFQAAVA